MRRGAHEGEEIVRRMELTLPCGLCPDCNAVTVAVESPEEKYDKKARTLQGPAPAAEGRIREPESSTATCHQQRQQQTTQQRQRKHGNVTTSGH